METIVVQRLRFTIPSVDIMAEKYYRVVFDMNGMGITDREMQLIVHTALNKGIDKEGFCKRYGTSAPTVNNMISRLKKMSVLVKEGGKLGISPLLALDFEKDIKLEIFFNKGYGE